MTHLAPASIRVAIALLLASTTVTAACSDTDDLDPGGSRVTTETSPDANPGASAATAAVEAVAEELHRAMGIEGRIEVLGTRLEACVDGIGRETDDVSAVLGAMLTDETVSTALLDAAGPAVGASDIRSEDIVDPVDGETITGRRVTLFASRNDRRIEVGLVVEGDTLTATYRSACP